MRIEKAVTTLVMMMKAMMRMKVAVLG